MTELLPCPFCGSKIKHVESWAKSFDPPRLYHEWHHETEDPNCQIFRFDGTIVASSTERDAEQKAAIDRWNRRAVQHAQCSPGNVSLDLMRRIWANLYFNEEDAGNTFQQTLDEVVDWLAARNALPSHDKPAPQSPAASERLYTQAEVVEALKQAIAALSHPSTVRRPEQTIGSYIDDNTEDL